MWLARGFFIGRDCFFRAVMGEREEKVREDETTTLFKQIKSFTLAGRGS